MAQSYIDNLAHLFLAELSGYANCIKALAQRAIASDGLYFEGHLLENGRTH